MISFSICQKQVHVYPSGLPNRPVIYLNTVAEADAQIYKALGQGDGPACSLVTVTGLDWNHDMAPWDIPAIARGGECCTGGAADYLNLLTGQILPRAERELSEPVSWRGIAGYSLGGLFALYALFHTDLFSRAASVSGSLWYPGLLEYVSSHEMKKKPECLYFSLGSQEHKTRNACMRTVQQNTEKIADICRARGIQTLFQLTPGNHFQNPVGRTAAGITWLLEQN